MKRLWVATGVLAIALFTAMPVFADRGSGGSDDGDRVSQQDRREDRQEDRQQDRQEDRQQDRQEDRQQDRQEDRQQDRQEDRQQDRQEDRQQDRQEDRQQDRQVDRQQDRQEDRQQDRQEDRQQDRQEDRQEDRRQLRVQDGAFQLQGVILTTDPATGMVTVLVTNTGQALDPMQMRITVQIRTRLERRAGSEWVNASFGQLQPGQTILARGAVSGDAWIASRVRVGK